MPPKKKHKVMELPDVQTEPPRTPLPLTRVGITNFRYPVAFHRHGNFVETIVSVTASIDLPKGQRGAHMSRFAEEIARAFHIPSKVGSLSELAEGLCEQLLKAHDYANHCTVFIQMDAHIDSNVYTAMASYSTSSLKGTVGVKVMGTLACPCSIALTGGMSHNQRGVLEIEVEADSHEIKHEDLALLAERAFSMPVRLLLKRPDEKRVVEEMHSNAKFVEDVVRDCVKMLKERYKGHKARVRCVSFESIHPYDCFAEWEGEL
ncbi:MAG: GTP cyclohydrolase I FolE2 [Armatimonadota bacterium]|nr:GTP cyclohydrolase I FolE2 [Armatimonadota bacterium]MCX7777679.1 GTP cyclohydrolase I FolE2 [Armatimonadota bacterium]MDW8025438.1 GTP cyclohydrolase I FolE2 [Armatimonadota bacterium]